MLTEISRFSFHRNSLSLLFFALLHHMVVLSSFLKMEDVMERDNKRCRIIAAVVSSIFICGIASKNFIVEGRLGNRTDADYDPIVKLVHTEIGGLIQSKMLD